MGIKENILIGIKRLSNYIHNGSETNGDTTILNGQEADDRIYHLSAFNIEAEKIRKQQDNWKPYDFSNEWHRRNKK